jgi:hypothetical protein
MSGKLIVNIIHRPELNPEYSEVTSGSKLDAKDLVNESFSIFLTQQELAHKYNLKTTIQMTYASLFNEQIIDIAKEHHLKYGDEIGVSLLGLPCKAFEEKYHTKDFCIWMFTNEDKESIIDDVFTLFHAKFGFYPASTSSYFLDAYSINYIKRKYPSIVCAVATCFEEGPKAYHTCNNSWYTIFDGGPWAPWIPSTINSHIPASSVEDDSGIVGIPHLSRDLEACFDGNGSNFGTHPQNVLRGMIYKDGEYPYLYNLIDQYHHLGKYNNDFAYNMMFVGPGWMNKNGRWEAPYELLYKSYDDAMHYYGMLKEKDKLVDMTMEEFAIYFRSKKYYKMPEIALWKDILYGSEKTLFWYHNSNFRFCLDLNQGGAMIDLRPYANRLPQVTGINTPNVFDASFPYLIQANYRAGYFTHYKGEGTIRSCKLIVNGESIDLALLRLQGTVSKVNSKTILTLDPGYLEFKDVNVKVTSIFEIDENEPIIKTTRLIEADKDAEIKVVEYIVAGYGTTEYQADLTSVTLSVDDEKINYNYHNRNIKKNSYSSKANIGVLDVDLELYSKEKVESEVVEGYAFSPVFTLSQTHIIKNKGETTVWLKVAKGS